MTNDDTEELFWKKGFSLNAKYILSEEVDFFYGLPKGGKSFMSRQSRILNRVIRIII